MQRPRVVLEKQERSEARTQSKEQVGGASPQGSVGHGKAQGFYSAAK